MEDLLKYGVAVIPVFNQNDLKLYNTAFWQTVKSFPEYINPSNAIYVQGAFGGLSNPASFHNPVVRHIRLNMMFKAVELFSQYPKSDIALEQLIDRMCIRRQGTTLGKETWHRDQAGNNGDSHYSQSDSIFGGWVNLDLEREQRFICIPGTHIERSQGSGFVTNISFDESQKKVYIIPPGHWIIFYQNIVHEVLPGKVKFDSIRLFLGFRLTNSSSSLFDESNTLRDQGVPHLPSGPYPTMFANNHLSFHAQNTINWANVTFKSQCLESKNTPKLGSFNMVHKVMRSLREYNLPMYPEYTEEELSILRPARSWNINGFKLEL